MLRDMRHNSLYDLAFGILLLPVTLQIRLTLQKNMATGLSNFALSRMTLTLMADIVGGDVIAAKICITRPVDSLLQDSYADKHTIPWTPPHLIFRKLRSTRT